MRFQPWILRTRDSWIKEAYFKEKGNLRVWEGKEGK